MNLIPKHRTVDALDEVWSSLRVLLADLADADWRAATALPGWDVQANVAHIIGTEKMLAGEPQPDVAVDRETTPHVRNDIGAFNEAWVSALAGSEPAVVLALFDDTTAQRSAVLRAMPQEEWDAESFTPAGRDTYGRFMQIRVFDCWFHEQDIREAVGRPGHDHGPAVEVALDEVANALGFVVGKRAGAPAGARVHFRLTGPTERDVFVEVGERAAVVPKLDGDATVTITVPVVAFTRLCGGRRTASDFAGQVGIEGDQELGERVLANLAYTI